jgi:transglutaminase-like putative cysteine protease
MKKISLFFVFLICFSFHFFGQVKQKNTPNWVQKTTYNTAPDIDLEENSEGILKLLYDHQVNRSTQELYYRIVNKIEENVGVQNGSSISVQYDPTYQTLVFHEIIVIRDGKTISKLKPNDFQLIRRELDAESFIYDGTLSATNNLSDIRVGDIIDWSYTITGINPIHGKKFSTVTVLNDYVPYGKMNITMLSKTPLEIQMENAPQDFKQSRANGMYKYQYTRSNIDALEYEENTPSWVIWSDTAFISDYKSWEEIANWGADIFRVQEPASSALRSEINTIKKAHPSKGARITAVLNFVQDEIRYLGLESGIGAYKPFPPNKVYEQRFGDCKDKSLLMVYMLRKMNIEAYPVLVNTYLKNTIENLVPSPKYFDHCIVKVVERDDRSWFYDPTISNQGGDYRNTPVPDYRWGLVLDQYTRGLEEISSDVTNNVDVVEEFILEEVGKGARLKVTTEYYDKEADFMRSYFKGNGTKSIKKDYESYMADYYPNITATQNPSFEDNIDDNIFTVKEFYKIDSLWTDSPVDEKNILATFQPYVVMNALVMPSKRERKHPFSLYYPSQKSHTMKVKLPEKWTIEEDFVNVSTDELDFSLITDYDWSTDFFTMKYSVKMYSDHVDPANFDKFYNSMNKINNSLNYSLIYPKPGASLFSMPKVNFGGVLIQILLVIAFVVVMIVITGKFLNKSSKYPDKNRRY